MRWKASSGVLPERDVIEAVEAFPLKFYWFASKGYVPHTWQILFHAMRRDDRLTRFRHLAAGRRGGKTLSAAWEVLFYCLYPAQFYRDFYAREWTDEPLWIWAIAKDYKVGRASWLTFLKVCRQAGLVHGVDYKINKSEKYVEFLATGTLLEFKTADDPQSLRGAGLDMIWYDEAAFIRDEEAYDVAYPALSDKQGGVITTTTPQGKNWLYEYAFSPAVTEDPNHASVEYWSIHNPYFPQEEWLYAKSHMHPMLFRQEYMAEFDAFQGIELLGEWLHYYVAGEPHPGSDDVRLPRNKDGTLPLELYMGIDPAVSIADTADRFAMSLIGIDKKFGQAYLLDLYAGRIPFPEQLNMIRTWHLKYRPRIIGIESNAYQAALAQMAATMPEFPPVVPILSKGKKAERILRMAPLFQIGKVRIHRNHLDFIDEWVSYDSTLKNTHDDTLDAVEIGLRTAGVLLPEPAAAPTWTSWADEAPASSIDDLRRREIANIGRREAPFDPDMGAEV